MQEKPPSIPQLIYSNVKSFVEQQQYFFDMLWSKAISSEQKIKEIEYGIVPDFIETIRDYKDKSNLEKKELWVSAAVADYLDSPLHCKWMICTVICERTSRGWAKR